MISGRAHGFQTANLPTLVLRPVLPAQGNVHEKLFRGPRASVAGRFVATLDLPDLRIHARLLGSVSTYNFQYVGLATSAVPATAFTQPAAVSLQGNGSTYMSPAASVTWTCKAIPTGATSADFQYLSNVFRIAICATTPRSGVRPIPAADHPPRSRGSRVSWASARSSPLSAGRAAGFSWQSSSR